MMRPFRSLRNLWRNVVHRRRIDEDLDQELRAYEALLVEEGLAAGETPERARRAAALEVGGVTQVQERVRDARTGAFLDTLVQDLRYGSRALRRQPGFTLAAVLVLALGIGANTAIFSVVYNVLLRALPFHAAERIHVVFMRFSPQNAERGNLSMPDFFDWRAGNHAFQTPEAFAGARFDMTGGGEPEQISGAVGRRRSWSERH